MMDSRESQVQYIENEERLKLVIPIQVNWLLVILYTASILIWLGMFALVLVYLIRGLSSSWVLTAILLFWLLVWLGFGRFLWTRWQYHVATREILYIEKDQIIVRRPVSLLGLTTSYDMGHVSPFYYSEKHSCPAFDYAYLHVYFGRGLTEDQTKELIAELNSRYFPDDEEE